jgi:hypothetical protein
MLEVLVLAVQYTKEVDKNGFPDTQFKFVHEVHYDHRKHLKP